MAELPGDYAMFGDGTIVVIKKTVAMKSEQTGVIEWEIGFRMLPEYERKFGILESEMEAETGLIFRKYPKSYFKLLDPNQNTKTWLIACSFDSESTPIMQEIGKELFTDVISYQKEIRSLKLKISRLERDNRIASEQPMKLVEEQIIPIAKKLQGMQPGAEGLRGE